jgi:hypothetical protein
MKGKQLTRIVPIVLLALLVAIPIAIGAHALTPYQSGYKHGVKDADMTYGLSNFMAQGGFGSHTSTFNQGYIDGWCSKQTPGERAGSDSDNGTFNCVDDVSSAAKNSTR